VRRDLRAARRWEVGDNQDDLGVLGALGIKGSFQVGEERGKGDGLGLLSAPRQTVYRGWAEPWQG
jgi:hypothetical protein